MSAYSVLDVYNLALYVNDLYTSSNKRLYVNSRVVQWPKFMYLDVLNDELRDRALTALDRAIEILPDNENIAGFENECLVAKNILNNRVFDQVKFNNFIDFTQSLDISRNQSFEQVFNYKLY